MALESIGYSHEEAMLKAEDLVADAPADLTVLLLSHEDTEMITKRFLEQQNPHNTHRTKLQFAPATFQERMDEFLTPQLLDRQTTLVISVTDDYDTELPEWNYNVAHDYGYAWARVSQSDLHDTLLQLDKSNRTRRQKNAHPNLETLVFWKESVATSRAPSTNQESEMSEESRAKACVQLHPFGFQQHAVLHSVLEDFSRTITKTANQKTEI